MKKFVMCMLFVSFLMFWVVVNSHAYVMLFGETIDGYATINRSSSGLAVSLRQKVRVLPGVPDLSVSF